MTNYELRYVPPSELPTPLDLEGNEVTGLDAQQREQLLMNRGLFAPVGDVYHCIGAFKDRRGQYKRESDLPGFRVTRGALNFRHSGIPKNMRQDILHARVFRHVDPAVSLRDLVNGNSDPEPLPAGVPATGKGDAKPPHSGNALLALEQAKALNDAGIARKLLVPLARVQDGDVVEENMLPAFAFAGERAKVQP